MPETPRFSVPRRAVPTLTWLAKLSTAEFESLRAALAADQPAQSRTELTSRLQRALPDASSGQGTALVRELFGLQKLGASHDWKIEDVSEVVSSDASIEIDDAQRSELRHRVNGLMSSPIVSRLAKASDISTEHKNIFHTVRILTDARPVFEDEPSSGIVGAIIVHTLHLGYFTSGDSKDIYIALADDDLALLENAVSRAREKGKALGSFIRASGLPNLTNSSE